MKVGRKPRKRFPRFGTLITYSTLLGPWPSVEDLRDRLSALNRSDVVLRITWCSAVVKSWTRIRNNQLDKRVRNYLFPFWEEQFDLWEQRFGEGLVFSRYTLLWLMRQAFLTCHSGGDRLDTYEKNRIFGEACLMANDLSTFLIPKPLPTDLTVAANFIPQTEYFSQEDYDRDIARTIHLLNDIAPRAVDTPLPAFAEEIQDLLGHRVTEYCDLAFASGMQPLGAQSEPIENYRVLSTSAQNFATTAISVTTAEQFLESISAEEQNFQERIAASQTHAADFTVFRDRPFLRRGAEFVPLDLGFILDKAGRGLFWTALKRCPGPRREELLRNWGEIFERYVNGLLAASVAPNSSFVDNPTFHDGAQVSDGVIREGTTTLIMLEYKASTISSAVKYADDPAALERLLESRFVLGQGQGRKGLAQLSNAIRRFSEGHAIVHQSSGTEIFPEDIRKVIPVLVHLDNALRTPGIPNYMNARFKSLGRAKRFSVTPLVLLPITELEEIEGYLSDMPLSMFLESFMKILKAEKAAVFLTPVLPVLKGKTRKNGVTLNRFDQYMDGMLRRVFPDETKGKP